MYLDPTTPKDEVKLLGVRTNPELNETKLALEPENVRRLFSPPTVCVAPESDIWNVAVPERVDPA
jgi:hypothetical protein